MKKKAYKTPLVAVARVALETGIAGDVVLSEPMPVKLTTWDSDEVIGDELPAEGGYVNTLNWY
jgi:hypothetical protein